MRVVETGIAGVLVVEPVVRRDARGFFVETYHAERYAAAGITPAFVQDNHSRSQRGTLRGLHWQWRKPQGKLVRALLGEIFDVAVDLRPESPTFGQWTGVTLSADDFRQLYVPPGLAHGYYVTSEVAEVEYKCTDLYDPTGEHGMRWDDPDLAIAWPLTGPPLLSERDQQHPSLRERFPSRFR